MRLSRLRRSSGSWTPQLTLLFRDVRAPCLCCRRHLEPEILVVDEVLAVGDAEFQKKCLGKMNEVSGRDGRTVLFVTHNMGIATSLCPNAIWLSRVVSARWAQRAR